jgi:CheY-like chemotaxis protein
MTTALTPRVLLIDDDPTVREVLRLTLKTNGFRCRTAIDGFEALTELRERIPDIIISDLRMPRMSGFELLPIIRKRFPQIAVVVSSTEPIDKVRILELPMHAYFQKGALTPEQLVNMLREVASTARSDRDHVISRGLGSRPRETLDQVDNEDKGIR